MFHFHIMSQNIVVFAIPFESYFIRIIAFSAIQVQTIGKTSKSTHTKLLTSQFLQNPPMSALSTFQIYFLIKLI